MMGNPRRHSISVVGLLLWGLCPFALAQLSEVDGTAVAESGALQPSAEAITAYLIFDRPLRLEDGVGPVPASEGLGAGMMVPESEDLLMERVAGIGSHQAAIMGLELAGGAWNAALAEELTAMGGLYQAQGSHPEAIDILSRAMQIIRINHGLDSLQQVPVVERLIDSFLAQGEWSKADQYQSYLYYMQHKVFGTGDPRMIPVLNSLARWNLQLFQVGYGEAPGLRLSNAYTLFKAASQIANVHFGTDDERYVSHLMDMASSAYLVSRNQGLMEEAGRLEYHSVQAMYAERMRQIDHIYAQGYREGEEALRQIVEHYESRQDNARQHAQARALLGDWYLIFERRRAAADQYRLAFELLSKQEDGPQLIDELFGHVVPLPAFSGSVEELVFNPVVPETAGREMRSGYVDVAVEVSDYGLVSNVEVLSADVTDEDTRVHALLRRKVRNSQFRPKLDNGEMVHSTDNRFRYHYRY